PVWSDQGPGGALLLVLLGESVAAGDGSWAVLPAARGPVAKVARAGSGGGGVSPTSRPEVSDDLAHRGGDVVDVALGHGGEERQRDRASVGVFGDRELPLAHAECLAEVRVEVDRDEMHRAADVLGAELGDEACAVDLQPLELEPDGIEMPRVRGARTRHRTA